MSADNKRNESIFRASMDSKGYLEVIDIYLLFIIEFHRIAFTVHNRVS